jgi:hypothetical protein
VMLAPRTCSTCVSPATSSRASKRPCYHIGSPPLNTSPCRASRLAHPMPYNLYPTPPPTPTHHGNGLKQPLQQRAGHPRPWRSAPCRRLAFLALQLVVVVLSLDGRRGSRTAMRPKAAAHVFPPPFHHLVRTVSTAMTGMDAPSAAGICAANCSRKQPIHDEWGWEKRPLSNPHTLPPALVAPASLQARFQRCRPCPPPNTSCAPTTAVPE